MRAKTFGFLLIALVFFSLGVRYDSTGAQYGGVQLQFNGHLTTAGSCQKVAQNQISCQVAEGTQGELALVATVFPSSYTVTIQAVSLPQWAGFQPVSGYGQAQTTCSFRPPTGTAGRTFELRFRASTAYGLSVDLVVTLRVVAGIGNVTDEFGRFSVSVGELPNTFVSGTLTRCSDGTPLSRVPVTVALIPATGVLRIRTLSDVGKVVIDFTGYGQVEVSDFSLLSSMDMYGQVTSTIAVGTVCVGGTSTVTWTTDDAGKFSVPLPGVPGATVTGTLTECGKRPLPNQTFSLRQMDDGFQVSVPGYLDTVVTEYTSVTFPFVNVTAYDLGTVCMRPAGTPDLRFCTNQVSVDIAPIDGKSCRCLGTDSALVASCESQKCRIILSDGAQAPGLFQIGNPVDPERNPGGVRITSLPEVVLRLQGTRDGDIKLRVEEVKDLTEAERERWIQLWNVSGKATVTFDPRVLPSFELIIDPENKVTESDEENNVQCQECSPSHSFKAKGRYEIWPSSGVLEPSPAVPSERWVVGKDKPLTLEAKWLEKDDGGSEERLDTTYGCNRDKKGIHTEVPVLCPTCTCYEWDLNGDGEVDATGERVEYTYHDNGVYTITLRAHLGGETLVDQQVVEVTDRPVVVLLPPRYGDVFIPGISVVNEFRAEVHENGNTIERVDFTLNGRTKSTLPAQPAAAFDMKTLNPFPQTNQLVVTAYGHDSENNPVSSEPKMMVIPAAPIPGWLGWIVSLSGSISADTSAPPVVKYGTSFTFPEPPLKSSFEVPSYVPLLNGEYTVKAKAELALIVSSKGTAQVEASGDAAFEKKGGDWAFSIDGKMSVAGTTNIGPPIRLTDGSFSASIKGRVAKDFDVSDAFPAVKAATEIPLIGRGIKYLAERAKIGLGLSASVSGEASFTSVDQGSGSCLEGFDCQGELSLGGGISASLTLDLSIVSASAYGNANLTARFTAPGEDIGFLNFESLNLSGSFGLKLTADLWLVEVEKDFSIPFSVQIASPEEGFSEPAETEWAIVERPYASPGYATYRGELSEDEELATRQLLLVSNAFPLAHPALATSATGRWLLWTTDDLEKPFPRGREIVASIGPQIDRMGPPRFVTDNDLPDSRPVIGLTGNGGVVAVWVQHTSPPAELTSLDDLTSEILKGLEVVYSVYDADSGQWETIERLSTNDVIDHSPRLVYGRRGITGVAWVRNLGGEVFPPPDGSSPDALYYAHWNGTSFEPAHLLTPELGGTQWAIAEREGLLVLVWVRDIDGDWATAGDNELFAATWRDGSWSATERLTENDVDDVRPMLVSGPSGGITLIWIRNDGGESGEGSTLMGRAFDGRTWTSESELFQAPQLISSVVAQNESGKTAVVWEGFSDVGPDLFATVFDLRTGVHTDPRQLTADRASEDQIAAGFAGDTLTVAFVRERFRESSTGSIERDGETFNIERLEPEGHDLVVLEVGMP